MAGLADDGGVGVEVGCRVVTETSGTDGTVVLKLTGELDLASVDSVRAIVDSVTAGGAHKIVFDLSGLGFMDSSGIALLLTTAERVASVTIREPSAIVRRVIEVTGLATTLPMTP